MGSKLVDATVLERYICWKIRLKEKENRSSARLGKSEPPAEV